MRQEVGTTVDALKRTSGTVTFFLYVQQQMASSVSCFPSLNTKGRYGWTKHLPRRSIPRSLFLFHYTVCTLHTREAKACKVVNIKYCILPFLSKFTCKRQTFHAVHFLLTLSSSCNPCKVAYLDLDNSWMNWYHTIVVVIPSKLGKDSPLQHSAPSSTFAKADATFVNLRWPWRCKPSGCPAKQMQARMRWEDGRRQMEQHGEGVEERRLLGWQPKGNTLAMATDLHRRPSAVRIEMLGKGAWEGRTAPGQEGMLSDALRQKTCRKSLSW